MLELIIHMKNSYSYHFPCVGEILKFVGRFLVRHANEQGMTRITLSTKGVCKNQLVTATFFRILGVNPVFLDIRSFAHPLAYPYIFFLFYFQKLNRH